MSRPAGIASGAGSIGALYAASWFLHSYVGSGEWWVFPTSFVLVMFTIGLFFLSVYLLTPD